MKKFYVIIIILLSSVVSFRFLYLSFYSYDYYYNLYQDISNKRVFGINAPRGRILDRNGNVLATNITTTTLYVVPNQIKDKEDTARRLATILDSSYEDMYKHVTKKTSIERIHPEGRRLSYETADKISDLKSVKEYSFSKTS